MTYQLENHKLLNHLDRVNDWLCSQKVIPVTAEISPSSRCNHRCLMCGYDYLKHARGVMPEDLLIKCASDLSENGVRGLVFAGDGEPFLNKALLKAMQAARKWNADIAVSTNGALLQSTDVPFLVDNLSWIRFSVNGIGKSYAKVHKCKESDFDCVLKNIERMVQTKNQMKSGITIGVQMVLLPDNIDDADRLSGVMKDLGVDYFVMKPFYHKQENEYGHSFSMNYYDYKAYLNKIAEKKTQGFYCAMRWDTLDNLTRKYDVCMGWPFFVYVRTDGELYPCIARQGEDDISLGNLGVQSFLDIWNGESAEGVARSMSLINVAECQPNCRHHSMNNFLWDLTRATPHVNFV